MSTHYDGAPALHERVRAARLVVTGRVLSVQPLPRARIGDVEEEQAVARIEIEKTLRGASPSATLDVRFVRARGESKPPAADVFRKDQRLVLLLVPDVGPDAAANVYVAYLGGAFALAANDVFTVEVPDETSRTGGTRKARMTVGALREIIKQVGAEEAAQVRDWAKVEPHLARRPTLPAVTELPDARIGGGPASAMPSPPRDLTSRATRKK